MVMTEKRQLTENNWWKLSSNYRKKTNWKKYKWSLRDLRINNKSSNVHFFEVPEGEEREYGSGKISEEILAENIWSHIKDINFYLKKISQQNSNRKILKKSSPIHIIIKILKNKVKDLDRARDKQHFTLKATSQKTAGFSLKIVEIKKSEKKKVFKCWN